MTSLLRASRTGDEAAVAEVSSLLYDELRRRAHALMRREPHGGDLQAIELVHEAFLRLAGAHVDWKDRQHFLAVSSRIMRRVLVDLSRARRYQKRGGRAVHVSLDCQIEGCAARSVDLMALDDALEALAAVEPRRARVIELRFYEGLTVEETACVLAVSDDTVARDWRLARTWLFRMLRKRSAA